jgi:hypothetical protein
LPGEQVVECWEIVELHGEIEIGNEAASAAEERIRSRLYETGRLRTQGFSNLSIEDETIAVASYQSFNSWLEIYP